ncbi:hypothetical protein, variant [Aphanomyces invadans]|uniref:SANTA domain-containing protein n=1 Tax=Aphanomyces invadans TaxID=157072 RepID=A0A024TF78_9STRA|nr:hypothetical protein, variant [Aphanomyces invadans]ETV92246.1 hypothetical protein, variant [Aphanomyces invadans]|eukprot:XP_008879210.1 hypothetical protein, variant [Aphanomyces invadans]
MDRGDVPGDVVRTEVLFRTRPPTSNAAAVTAAPGWSSPYPTLLPRHVLETDVSTPQTNRLRQQSVGTATTPIQSASKTNVPSSREDFLALYQKSPMPRILVARQQRQQTPPPPMATSTSAAPSTTPSTQTPRRRYIFRSNLTAAASPRAPTTPSTTSLVTRDQRSTTSMPPAIPPTHLPDKPQIDSAPPPQAPVPTAAHRPPTPLRHLVVAPSNSHTAPLSTMHSPATQTSLSTVTKLTARFSPFHRSTSAAASTPPAKVRLSFEDPPPSFPVAKPAAQTENVANDATMAVAAPKRDANAKANSIDTKNTAGSHPTDSTSKMAIAPSSMVATAPLRNAQPTIGRTQVRESVSPRAPTPQETPLPKRTLSTTSPLNAAVLPTTPSVVCFQETSQQPLDNAETKSSTRWNRTALTPVDPQRRSGVAATSRALVPASPTSMKTAREEPSNRSMSEHVCAAGLGVDRSFDHATSSLKTSTPGKLKPDSMAATPSRVLATTKPQLPSMKKRGPGAGSAVLVKKQRRVPPTDATSVGDGTTQESPRSTACGGAPPRKPRGRSAPTRSSPKLSSTHRANDAPVARWTKRTSSAKGRAIPPTSHPGDESGHVSSQDEAVAESDGARQHTTKLLEMATKAPVTSRGADKASRKRSRDATARPGAAAKKSTTTSLAKFLSFDDSEDEDERATKEPLDASALKTDRPVLALRKWTVVWPPPLDGPSVKLVVHGDVGAGTWESHAVERIRRPRLFVSDTGQHVSLVGAMARPRQSSLPAKVADHFEQGIPSDWVNMFHAVLGTTPRVIKTKRSTREASMAATARPESAAGGFSLFHMFCPESDGDEVAPRTASTEAVVSDESSASDVDRAAAAAKQRNRTNAATTLPRKPALASADEPVDASASDADELASPWMPTRKPTPSKGLSQDASWSKESSAAKRALTTRSGRRTSPVKEWWKAAKAIPAAATSESKGVAGTSVWSKRQLASLKHAVRVVDPKHPQYWHKVASLVDGKSSAECQEKQFESVGAMKHKSTSKAIPPTRQLSKPGTRRFKKQVRQFVAEFEAGHAGDDDVCDLKRRPPSASTSRLTTPKSIRKYKRPPDHFDDDLSSDGAEAVLLQSVPPAQRDKLDAYKDGLLSQTRSGRTKLLLPPSTQKSTWAAHDDDMFESSDTVRETMLARGGARRLEGVLTPRGSMRVRVVKKRHSDDSSVEDSASSDDSEVLDDE